MEIYHFNSNGLYTGRSEARPDPKEPGSFLIPIRATTIVPPLSVIAKVKLGLWDGTQWYEVDRPPVAPPEDMTPAVRRRIIKQYARENTANLIRSFSYGNSEYLLTEDIIGQLREAKDLVELTSAAGGNVDDLFPYAVVVNVDEDGNEVVKNIGSVNVFYNVLIAIVKHIVTTRAEGRALIQQINNMAAADVPLPETWADPRYA